jgi:hypothetical protein
MHETPDDLVRLQATLDRSYERAGPHLLEIITPERRLTAQQLVDRLHGMCLLVLATATADGRPINGPVDGIFYRGDWYFGSSPESVRFRHVRQRPWVSATHMPAESFSTTTHGIATQIDVAAPEAAGFRRALLEVYVPLYGADWERFIDSGPVYARIEAQRMFTFHMELPGSADAG